MNANAIVALIKGLIEVGTEAATAWGTVSAIVAEGRDPTVEEWRMADMDADAAHSAVAALT
jgi:hypothetical protein